MGRVSATSLIFLGLLAALFQNCTGFVAPSSSPIFNLGLSPTFSISGQAGTYAVDLSNSSDIEEMASMGMLLHIGSETMDRTALKKNGAKLIVDESRYIYRFCTPGETCTKNPVAEQQALVQFENYLKTLHDDNDVVGFWILDDYNGLSAPSFLVSMHELVKKYNVGRTFPRVTMCAFGVNLDVDVANLSARDPAKWDEVLSNFSPNACDYVVTYNYAIGDVSTNSDRFDWAMTRLLPDFFQSLRARGWDPARQPFIGMPGAFASPVGSTGIGYVKPSRANLAQQIQAFCQAGAVAILPFIWRDDVDPFITPSRDSELKSGLNDGLESCRTNYWHR